MRRTQRAFTLVELLTVVAIIALLVSILLPTLGRAKAMARKAACSAQMSPLGSAIAMYVGANRSYPFMGNAFKVDENERGYPKMNAILTLNNFARTGKSASGLDLFQSELADIWKGTLCPAMDANALYSWAEKQYLQFQSDGNPTMGKAYIHRAGIGYQWNSCLRAATPDMPFWHCGAGRWSPKLDDLTKHPNYGGVPGHEYALITWIDPRLFPPNGGKNGGAGYAAQAVNPDEVDSPRSVAEAWDSFDLNSFPNIDYRNWDVENYDPAWHVGPANYGSNGRAILNAARHDGSPNILYADGHVAADAGTEVRPSDMGACPAGNWNDMRAVTWSDYDKVFGTLQHIVPQKDFYPTN